MKAHIQAYDSAYPGSMVDRDDGYYLCRNDHKSLAAGLVELIASRDRELEDLRDTSERLHAANVELAEALKGMDEAYCRAGYQITKAERHEDRLRLIACRAAIAKHGATS